MKTKKKSYNFFSEKTGLIISGVGIGIIFVSLFVFVRYRSWDFGNELDESIIAQFGDFIGGVVGSLFALAGFILYYVALKDQRNSSESSDKALKSQIEVLNKQVEEFQAQKIELSETRKVYEEQTKLFREQTEYYNQQTREYKRQTTIINRQQFDFSFYSLLNVLFELKKSILETDNLYFDRIYDKIKINDIKNKSINECYSCILIKYDEVFYENRNTLGHYFKTIYRILKLIDTSDLQDNDKIQYAKVFRSQLTDEELLLLYYNYHSNFGFKVRGLALKYDIFKHIAILNKIEFDFDREAYRRKIKLLNFINNLTNLIQQNLKDYYDIENANDIDIKQAHSFLDINCEIELIIKERLVFTISFEKSIWDNQTEINESELKHIISGAINDILFLSKFIIPMGNEISTDRKNYENSTEFCFEIPINSLIK